MSTRRQQTKNKKTKKINDSDEEQFQMNLNAQEQEEAQSQEYIRQTQTTLPSTSTRERRTRIAKTLNQDYIYKMHYEEHYNKKGKSGEKGKMIPEEEKMQQEKDQEPKFLTPKIECLLYKRIRKNQTDQKQDSKTNGNSNGYHSNNRSKQMNIQGQNNQEQNEQIMDEQYQDQDQFLVKFQGRSYLRLKWMTKDQIEEQLNITITSGMLKSLSVKMKKLTELKLGKQHYFNPSFTQADRILSSTQIFTAIHHKKANQIKGKWDQSIMLVCSKMLNFIKDGYPYGVHFHQPYVENMQETLKIQNQTNLGQIINRIYLSQIKSSSQFWSQVGRAINLYFQIYQEKQSDNYRVGICIMQCAIFLYQQWYNLCKQRYNILRNEMIENKIIEGEKMPVDIQEENNKEDQIDTPQVQENYQQIDIMKFCKTNIFLTQKIAQTPKNQAQLELLNPGIFSFDWLQEKKESNNSQTKNKQKKTFNLDSDDQQKSKGMKPGQKFLNYQYKELEYDDMKALNLNVQVDRLYLVKWKDLSYAQSSWQTQSIINNPSKIIQFKNWNKIPNRQTRQKVQIHNKIHKFLLTFYEQPQNRIIKNPNIAKMQKKLYLLNGSREEPRQYGGKDIPIFKNYRMLKQFQLQSLNWLIKNWYQNRNCILADEMGLGKTIQTISFLYHLHTYENVLGPFLVLAPLTTLPQWRRQIQEWTEFNCLLYYDQGSVAAREIIQNYQFFHNHTTKNGDIIPSKIPKFQVLLVNYELFVNDFQILKKIPFQHMVLDQAHRLKNKRSNTTKILSQLPCCRKTLLTGTPIQNNTKQLWTLLNFIQPFNFSSQEKFLQIYGNLNNQQEVKQFKRIIKPYILRRIKQDVQKTIPKLYQMIIDVQLTKKQKQIYRGLLQKNKNDMIKGLSSANFNAIAIQLRKCCNHPFLISNDLQQAVIKEFNNNQHEAFMKTSGKMILLIKLLKKFKMEGKKVLIFSQFVIMLDLIKDFLQRQGYNVQILKGSINNTIRHQSITRFNEDPNTDIFLISTKAGGVGINLISASQIVIYDSDWNPQNDIQATARAHRIGQKKQVTVYRLITSNTYQAQMFQISSKKLGLDKAVFMGQCFKTSGEFNQAQKQMTKDQIQTLLKKGVLGFLQNQGNQEQYFNQTIQDILQKNARKIQYAANPTSTAYSKTKFVAQQGHNDISLDAPDFWQRALKNVQTPIDKLCKKQSNLKQYQAPLKQQQLMIQTFNLIYQFVRNKTVGTGFNNQDQRQLNKFLEAVAGQRKFMRKYRDIANTFLEEIEKPSRRFRVKYEDLLLDGVGNGGNNSNGQIHNKEKNLRINRSKRHMNQQDDIAFEDEDDGQLYSGVSSGQKQSNQESPQTIQRLKYLQDLQKLCYYCKKPKCTIFCAGICGRSYHRKCFENILNNEQDSTNKIDQLQQIQMSFTAWKQNLEYDQKCPICLSEEGTFSLTCEECGNQGTFKPEEKKKKKKITDYLNKEQEQNQGQKSQDTLLYQCSVNKCFNFFHLKCLFKKQYENKFLSSGKPVTNISQVNTLFRCPSHYCRHCYGTDQALLNKSKIIKCSICPKAYHQKKCLSMKNFIKIMKNVYLCANHIQENGKSQEDIKKEYEPFKKFLQSSENEISAKDSKKKKKQEQEEKNKRIVKRSQPLAGKSLSSSIIQKQYLNGSKQQKKKKTKTAPKIKYTYSQLNLTPVLTFDYSSYPNYWCRYCGSRYAKSFKQGPWGVNTLCSHHYDLWKSKRITIPDVQNPLQPIHRDKQTQIKYLNDYMAMHTKIKPNELISVLETLSKN